MPPSIFDAPLYLFVVVLGIALIVLARWAARRKGTRWETFVALRVGDVLFTEVVGAFLIGFGIGALIVPQLDSPGPTGPPGPPVAFRRCPGRQPIAVPAWDRLGGHHRRCADRLDRPPAAWPVERKLAH